LNKAPNDEIILHIVACEPLDEGHKEKFRQLGVMFPGTQVVIYDEPEHLRIIDESISEADGLGWGKGGLTILTLDKILPVDISKVICLDGDILVYTSLIDFWQKLPRSPYYVAGVRDHYNDDPTNLDEVTQNYFLARMRKLIADTGILPSFYINSGVLLFDLKHTRKHAIFPKIIRWIVERHPSFPDQDGINFGYQGRILECRGKWNTFCYPLTQHPDIVIAHFAGLHRKPWHYREVLDETDPPALVVPAIPPAPQTQPSVKLKDRPIQKYLSRHVPQIRENKAVFLERLIDLPAGASLAAEAWNALQKIPEVSNMLLRLGWLRKDRSSWKLNHSLDVVIAGLSSPIPEDRQPTPLRLPMTWGQAFKAPRRPQSSNTAAFSVFNADLDPFCDFAPSQEEIELQRESPSSNTDIPNYLGLPIAIPQRLKIKPLPGGWVQCQRNSLYRIIIKENPWIFAAFQPQIMEFQQTQHLTFVIYLHPAPEATAEQLEAIRSAFRRDWSEISSVFNPDNFNLQQRKIIDAIINLLPKRSELGLVTGDAEEGGKLHFSILWHWYREMSPWRHY
jgi:hypothetical protein